MGMRPNTHLTLKYVPVNDEYLNDPVITSEESYINDEYVTVDREEDFGKSGETTITLQLTYGYGDFIEWSEAVKKHTTLDNFGKYLLATYGGSYSIHLHACFD